jgi:hypothetical protein
MSEQLKQLIYISRKSPEINPEEVDVIVERAQYFNEQVSITGALISVGEYFYQLLEGNEEIISNLMARIQLDKRHIDLKVIYQGDIAEREFSKWSMKRVHINEKDVPSILIKIAELEKISLDVASSLKYLMGGKLTH